MFANADNTNVQSLFPTPSKLLRLAVLATLLGVGLQADPDGVRWVRVSESSIDVYTQEDPSQAADLLKVFLDLRSALAQTSVFHVNETAPLKVVAFHSQQEFNQYRLNSGSCAFYQQTERSEYVVLQDLARSHREVSAHEFTHFVLAHAGVKLPLWLNEGIADFYSTYQISGDRVIFGHSVTGRLPVLRKSEWLALDDLFQISTASSYYSDPDRMALFYSESWALAHMLMVSPQYAARFPEFLRALNEGHASAESMRIAYGKTARQVQQDLRDYLDGQHLPTVSAQFKLPLASEASAVTGVSNAEMDVTLGELIPNNARTQEAVASRLTSAATQLADNASAEESLGYLALRQGKSVDAGAHFQKAVDRHSNDATVYFYLAHLRNEAGAPASEVIPLLEHALSLKPDLNDARLELALVATGDGRFEQALEALKKVTAPRPENAYATAYTEAYCYAHLEKFTEARSAAAHAQSIASNQKDRAEVAELLDFIAQQQ